MRLTRLRLKKAGKIELFENSSLGMKSKATSGKESAKKRNKHEEISTYQPPQEREKVSLGKRSAIQMEIEFDKEAIIE